MANITSETASKANGATHEFKNKVLNAENQIEKMSQGVVEKVETMASDIATSASDYVKTGRDYVKENPAKGIAMAAAAGVVFGSLVTLALRRRQQ